MGAAEIALSNTKAVSDAQRRWCGQEYGAAIALVAASRSVEKRQVARAEDRFVRDTGCRSWLKATGPDFPLQVVCYHIANVLPVARRNATTIPRPMMLPVTTCRRVHETRL